MERAMGIESGPMLSLSWSVRAADTTSVQIRPSRKERVREGPRRAIAGLCLQDASRNPLSEILEARDLLKRDPQIPGSGQFSIIRRNIKGRPISNLSDCRA